MMRGACAAELTLIATEKDREAIGIEAQIHFADAENQINDFDSSSTVCDMSGDESMSSTTSMEGGAQMIPHHLHHESGAESYIKDINSTFTSLWKLTSGLWISSCTCRHDLV
jgi:hypothetical protein